MNARNAMTNWKRSRIISAVGLALSASMVLGVASDAAMAQTKDKDKRKQEDLKPPVPPNEKEMPTHYWGLAALLLGIGVVLTANLIPSKRGHQD